MSEWNATAAPEKQVCIGDRIIETNGKTDVAQMQQQCSLNQTLSMRLRRSEPLKASLVYEIELDKRAEGSRIGISFDQDYTITNIKDGLVSKWNATAAPNKRVCIGDRIIETNGKTGVDDMQRECKQKQVLSMKLRRPRLLEVRSSDCSQQDSLGIVRHRFFHKPSVATWLSVAP